MNTKVSNCITYIPQDIKLELNNGTLTLKAGSKVYVPNGAGVFNTVTIANDLLIATPSANATQFILYTTQGGTSLGIIETYYTESGESSTLASTWRFWFDTTNNIIKRTDNGGSSWSSYGYSFPVALITNSGSGWTSIDQVFNGFGYIGSTIFALPGVKGLIPNGRNADGSLKSIEVVQNSVKILTMGSYMAGRKYCPLELFFNNELGGMEIDFNSWGTVATLKDLPRDKLYAAYYCLEDNLVHYFNNTGVESINKSLFAATFAVGNDNKITSFTPKTVFHALDYNDKSTISGWSMPSNKYIDLTLGASGSTYIAPANGILTLRGHTTSTNKAYGITNNANGCINLIRVDNLGNDFGVFMLAQKGQPLTVTYEGSLASGYVFRFIYAEGDKPSNVVSSSGGSDHESGGESGGFETAPWD